MSKHGPINHDDESLKALIERYSQLTWYFDTEKEARAAERQIRRACGKYGNLKDVGVWLTGTGKWAVDTDTWG